MLRVAIASENDAYDGEIYRRLAERLLQRANPAFDGVDKWTGGLRFSGDQSVFKLARLFLEKAAGEQITHAILGVDNDGGMRNRPLHEVGHVRAQEAADPKDGCRVCRLEHAIPTEWASAGRRYCAVVPIQAMETWLLTIQDDSLRSIPERNRHHRPTLKKMFFRKPLPPLAGRVQLALAEVNKPIALDILRQRPSFKHFEEQINGWR